VSLKRKIKIIIPILAVFLFVIIFVLLNIHSFLAADRPVDADVLIVEGWIANIDRALEEAIEEFHHGKYKLIIAVGGPANRNKEHSYTDNHAERAAQGLIALGFNKALIHKVTVPPVQKNDTFSMALASRIWLENNGIEVKGVNVFTFGAHARKSEAVFRQVFEPDIKVGVISATPFHYNPKFWWLSVIGWKWVFYDSIKYLFAEI
jgi:hypothetical protein